jgi:hypothetical protein
MKPFTGLMLTALLTATLRLSAQTAESPPRYVWIATPCDTWGCAIAAIASANGDPFVIVLPTKSSAHPWVVLKRMLAGTIEGPIDGTFTAECFDTMLAASTRFDSIASDKIPILVTMPDGGMLVVCMHETQTIGKRRSVR